MEANKENLNRHKEQMRITLPVHKLPTIPRSDNPQNERRRIPLRTINTDSHAGSSHTRGKVASKQNVPSKVSTKFVTLRQKNDDLDWNYNVFKDDDIEIITISDDDVDKDENKEKLNPGAAKCSVTPTKRSPPEPIRVKNIKRSLKRPHSRELQGISPIVSTEMKDDKCKRRLKFNERREDVLQSPNYFKKSYTKCIERDYLEDLFLYLLSIERPGQSPAISSLSRACVLNWIMKINGPDGNPAVVQTATWYMDSVLSICSVRLDQLQQVAAACFWIAQKIYGPSISASQLVKYSNNAFSCTQLMVMEKAILNKLKFPTQPVVPQDFISYLSWRSDSSHPGEIEITATFLCMCGMLVDKSLCTELPSSIAIACIRNALRVLKRRDLMLQLQSCPIYEAISKKVGNSCSICSALRRAVNIVAGPEYEYKAPLKHFGTEPHFIAQKVVSYAKMPEMFGIY
ncbi:uncharacterized protein [Battus philenor]|uniref:uncharacterized protein n=1 Tax=Battus philenor TaxID=42288 RepID=UPI0035CEF265